MPNIGQSIFVAALALMMAGPVAAQQNSLIILQQGTANIAAVEQNAGSRPARRSTVGPPVGLPGSTVDLSRVREGELTLQLPAGSTDTITFDESLVDGLDAAGQVDSNGLFLDPLNEASSQIGDGNEIDITVQGVGAAVGFVQAASGVSGAADNRATIVATGDAASASLFQSGQLNEATLNASADESFAGITQIGNRNIGSVSVTSRRARGTLVQIGDRNTSGEIVVDGIDTNVVVTQQGNDLTPVAGAPGVSVLSNAPAVTIRQTTLGR